MSRDYIKPSRTLGVSLAIIASVMLFSLLPLMQVGMVMIVRARLQTMNLDVPGESDAVTPIAVGGSYTGVPDASLTIQVVLGIAFLIIAVFAWRGRPRWIRFVMLAGVLVLTIVTIGMSIVALYADPDLSSGIDSGAAIVQVLLSGRMLMSILVALYVVWYMNRGPARAFYRGYYLAQPKEIEAPIADV